MNFCYLLSEHVELRVRDDYCILVDRNHGSTKMLHPSEAVVLSLLDGKTTYSELLYIISETYRLPQIKAEALLDGVFKKTKQYLSVASPQDNLGVRRYDPKSFLFPSSFDESRYKQPLKAPLLVNLVLTRKCNFRCSYCYFGDDLNRSQDLREDVALNLIDEAANLGVVIVNLSGGEPFLYRNICNIVSAITERRMIPKISTNGSLLNSQMINNLKQAGLKAIQVSLDAPDAESHHLLTHSTNTFQRVISAIKELKSQGFWVNVKGVMTPINYSSVENLIDLLVSLGVDEIHLYPASPGSCEISSANSIRTLNAKEIAFLKKAVTSSARKHNKEQSILLSEVEKSWQNPHDILRCGNLFSSLVVHTTGNVSVCEEIESDELSYGNVYDSHLKDIWLGSVHQHLLKSTKSSTHIDEKCSVCEYLDYCHTGCFNTAKLYEGNFLAKDPRCPGGKKMELTVPVHQ